MTYQLAKHAFFCFADNHCVFLDLRSDKYFCLGRTHTDAIKGLLNGPLVANERSCHVRINDANPAESDVVVQALVRKGLLVRSIAGSKSATPVRVDLPSASAMEVLNAPRPRLASAHMWHFLAAAATASRYLRWLSIEQTVRAVEDRKRTRATAAAAVEAGAITELFLIFQILRPYYPRPFLCLFDSLALLHFLARYGVFPLWVYGVKLEPFEAHCWVQVGDVVVNDILDNVRGYTPIMVV